ncbi:MAG TPA: pentapeptide repeat-containing protein [Rhodothermales bacterium]
MLQKLYTRIERLAAERPVLLAFWVFVAALLIVIPISMPFYIGQTHTFWMNVVAEAHGTVFDLLIIGWFLLWLNKIAERRLRNGRYREEIDDYLGWKSPEATHRIVGNVRRLNRGGTREKLRLTEAFLAGANLSGSHLRESDLWGAVLESAVLRDADLTGSNLAGADLDGADLERARLIGADMRGCALKEADLERAVLDEADLRGAMLNGADLQYASLRQTNLNRSSLQGANLRAAILEGTNLSGANLRGANLRGAVLTGADLRLAELDRTDFLGANLTDAILPEDAPDLIRLFAPVKTLFGARFSPGIDRVLFEARPALFEMAHSAPTWQERAQPEPAAEPEPAAS